MNKVLPPPCAISLEDKVIVTLYHFLSFAFSNAHSFMTILLVELVTLSICSNLSKEIFDFSCLLMHLKHVKPFQQSNNILLINNKYIFFIEIQKSIPRVYSSYTCPSSKRMVNYYLHNSIYTSLIPDVFDKIHQIKFPIAKTFNLCFLTRSLKMKQLRSQNL